MTNGFSAAMIELLQVQRATEEELIEIAEQQGFDLRKYIIKKY